jgi:CTP synthase
MKCIFVTGGVLSGIGKGIVASSVGALLKASGYKVFFQKFDGYLNVDPGTMSPFQHGEVFVTEDGAETDLDIGHYERFIDSELNKLSSFTSGRLFEEVISKERRGDYLGKTVQIVPHLTDLVKAKIREGYESSGADVSIIEIGGTVGDMENEYFIESARQLGRELGRENSIFIHVTLLPYLGASKELKTKPTQHAVRTLMSYGITPDFVVLRSDAEIPEDIMAKTAYFCSLDRGSVIAAPSLPSIYQVPVEFERQGVRESVLDRLGLPAKDFDFAAWQTLADNIAASSDRLVIGMIGKYNDLEDAYYSLNEGLRTAGFGLRKKVDIRFIDAESLESGDESALESLDGICIPGGFGVRGTLGKIRACRYARERKIPYLGICLGSQIMAIEFARDVLGLPNANSQEFDPASPDLVVHIMDSQKNIVEKGGTMRLGTYPCNIAEGSLAHRLYGSSSISERHRHRYEFNNTYRQRMEENGFRISGTSPDGSLVEIVEVADHPFMIGSQFHPEFKSRPTRPHPLFVGFVRAMSERARG